MGKRFEVRTNTWCDGWVNGWHTEDDEGNTLPMTFDTVEEAQAEIDEFLNDMNEAHKEENPEEYEEETGEDLGIFDTVTGEPVG